MRTLANLKILSISGERYNDAECLIVAGVDIFNLSESSLSLRFGSSKSKYNQRKQFSLLSKAFVFREAFL